MNRRRAGYKAKQVGLTFEGHFASACRYAGIMVVPIPMGAKVVKVRGRLTMLKVKTPFDFVLIKDGRTACVDTKTVEGETYCYSMITKHQVDVLAECEVYGIKAGYVVYFRKTNRLVFFSGKTLATLRPRESLNVEHGEDLGDAHQPNLSRFV